MKVNKQTKNSGLERIRLQPPTCEYPMQTTPLYFSQAAQGVLNENVQFFSCLNSFNSPNLKIFEKIDQIITIKESIWYLGSIILSPIFISFFTPFK